MTSSSWLILRWSRATQAANYRFTELDDDVLNHGWEVKAPFYTTGSILKCPVVITTVVRTGCTSNPSSTWVPSTVANLSTLRGPIGEVFSTRNINDTANDFIFARAGSNNQSYLAGHHDRRLLWAV